MKKLFVVLAVASLGFVACNNDAETKTTNDSTATVAQDSAANTPVVNDSLTAPVKDSTAKTPATDSAAKK